MMENLIDSDWPTQEADFDNLFLNNEIFLDIFEGEKLL